MNASSAIRTSVFEMFKVGIGPSSSHTVGPMKACASFVNALRTKNLINRVGRVQVELYGSLSLTGKGHSTDTACMYGLFGLQPDSIDLPYAQCLLRTCRDSKLLPLAQNVYVPFVEDTDIFWIPEAKQYHPNALTVRAKDRFTAETLLEETYYSIGGGFVQSQEEVDAGPKLPQVEPQSGREFYVFSCADDLLQICAEEGVSFSDIALRNEQVLYGKSKEEVYEGLDKIWDVMSSCIHSGLNSTQDTLPGSLKVKRRAPKLKKQVCNLRRLIKIIFEKADKILRNLNQKLESSSKVSSHLQAEPRMAREHSIPLAQLPGMSLISIYALAVGEENAAGHRVVTAPTNGACGIIPAVIKYSLKELILKNFHGVAPRLKYESVEHATVQAPRDFLLTAALVGMLYKHNASISGAESGCQGEVGVATSMASAGLCEILGGTPSQVERAAEIGMEHSLGLTCDPVGGLVQIPCMERNAVSSNKAVNAASMAILSFEDTHKVSLDQVIRVMKRTGDEMSAKYKETALGGLALEFDLEKEDMLRSGYTVDKPAC